MSSGGRSFSSIGRVATYAIPTLAVVVTALVLLGPGALRSAVGARVRGVPIGGGRAVALRIETVRSVYDVADPAEIQGITVEASAPGQGLPAWHGASGPDGIAEVHFDAAAPVDGLLALRITAPAVVGRRPRVLAEGQFRLRAAPPVSVQRGALAGLTRGDLAIRVEAARGFLASPFLEELRISVSSAGVDTRAELSISAPGADLSGDKVTTDERGAAAIRVRPLAHQIELSIDAVAGERKGHWEGTLPVVPGAIWLAPAKAGEPLTLVSPAPRERAYLSIWSEEGRVLGAVVPLARDPQGFFRGEVRPALPPSARLLFATVAGDPKEQGAGTLAWPIRPAEGAAAPRPLELLLDGVPASLEHEKARASAARRAGVLLIGAAAVVEMLLLLLQSRAAQQKLEAHMEQASSGSDGEAPMPCADRADLLHAARDYPVLRVLLLVAVIGLGFAMVAAMATFR
jgi:hypothetical protein